MATRCICADGILPANGESDVFGAFVHVNAHVRHHLISTLAGTGKAADRICAICVGHACSVAHAFVHIAANRQSTSDHVSHIALIT